MKKVFFLSSATFTRPTVLVEPGPILTTGRTPMCCTVAVCVRDDDSLILVDAGNCSVSETDGSSHTTTSAPLFLKTLGHLARRLSLVEEAIYSPIASQLEKLGYDLRQVKTVVATHCHHDHIAGLKDFPEAELVTTTEEVSAMGKIGIQPMYCPRDIAGTDRIRPVQLTGRRLYGFPSSLDLTGDGEITLLAAEGHTMGHVAVAIRNGDGLYIHVGDAMLLEWEAGYGCSGPSRLSQMVSEDSLALKRTLKSIRNLSELPDPPVVVPSSDMNVFQNLPHE